jgi:predicted ATPase
LPDFRELCDSRSQNDYIELGKTSTPHCWPMLKAASNARDDSGAFNLVRTSSTIATSRLIISAEVEQKTYTGGRSTFEFQRTLSRWKMQSC